MHSYANIHVFVVFEENDGFAKVSATLICHYKSWFLFFITELSTMTAAVDDNVNPPPYDSANTTNDESM